MIYIIEGNTGAGKTTFINTLSGFEIRKNMKFIIGLVGSGKTTWYKSLNETEQLKAVEIELPQSCLKDEKIKNELFNLYYNNPNIECIIAHPYYLPNDFWERVNPKDEFMFLDVPIKERTKRIKKRSKKLRIKTTIFPKEFLEKEEEDFIKFKEQGGILYGNRYNKS